MTGRTKRCEIMCKVTKKIGEMQIPYLKYFNR